MHKEENTRKFALGIVNLIFFWLIKNEKSPRNKALKLGASQKVSLAFSRRGATALNLKKKGEKSLSLLSFLIELPSSNWCYIL